MQLLHALISPTAAAAAHMQCPGLTAAVQCRLACRHATGTARTCLAGTRLAPACTARFSKCCLDGRQAESAQLVQLCARARPACSVMPGRCTWGMQQLGSCHDPACPAAVWLCSSMRPHRAIQVIAFECQCGQLLHATPSPRWNSACNISASAPEVLERWSAGRQVGSGRAAALAAACRHATGPHSSKAEQRRVSARPQSQRGCTQHLVCSAAHRSGDSWRG